jgi:hypothetical protein
MAVTSSKGYGVMCATRAARILPPMAYLLFNGRRLVGKRLGAQTAEELTAWWLQHRRHNGTRY